MRLTMALLALGVAGAGTPAVAAPQILGLVASAPVATEQGGLRDGAAHGLSGRGATPLVCDAAGCRAELSSFCLQQPRANPAPGTAYLPAADAEIFLVGVDSTGAAVRVAAAPYLRFTSSRGFTAVTAELSGDDMRRLGLERAAVEVGRDVSLLPVAAADDPDPQSAADVDAATGAVRGAAIPFFDAAGESGDAIRATNAMINALPATGRDPSDSDGRLISAAAAAQGTAAAPAGLALARRLHAACVGKVDVTHHVYSMRDCLEGSHDRLVTETNIRFWESLGGS